MEIGAFKRVQVSAIFQPSARPEPASSGVKTVETELKTSKAVAATAGPSDVTRDDNVRVGISDEAKARARREQALRDTITKHLDINPSTRDVIIKSVRQETGEVVRQYPDEAMLRLREFAVRMREQTLDESMGRRGDGERVNATA